VNGTKKGTVKIQYLTITLYIQTTRYYW